MKAYITNFFATTKHKAWVLYYCCKAAANLVKRGVVHDFSKYGKAEEPYFTAMLSKLKDTPYGTPEYKKLLDTIQPALDHHYKVNSHHPEYYPNGTKGMTNLDKIEMLCDWKAAGKRHKTSSIRKSLEINKARFNMTYEEVSALQRDAVELGLMKKGE